MKDSEIKTYITKLKAKLSNMYTTDSDKAIAIRKTIGSLLIDLGIPALHFSTNQANFVIDYFDNPNFGKDVQDMIVKMEGMIGLDVAGQLVLQDYMNPGDVSEIDETVKDDDFFASAGETLKKIKPKKKPQLATQNIHNETIMPDEVKKKMNVNKKKSYPRDTVEKNWRVMPRAVLTGDYDRDSIICQEMIDDLYSIKDSLKTKGNKFYEVNDMINQYQYALRSVDFEEKQRIKQEHFDKTHYELLNAMVALTKAMELGNTMFDLTEGKSEEFSIGTPDVSETIVKDMAFATGIPQKILMGDQFKDGTTPAQRKEDPLKDDFMTQLDEAKRKRQKQEDIATDIEFGGHIGFEDDGEGDCEVCASSPELCDEHNGCIQDCFKCEFIEKKRNQFRCKLKKVNMGKDPYFIRDEFERKPKKKQPMPIGTVSIPTRLLMDKDGKSIAFKNLSEEAQAELRSLRAQKAANTRRRNKILSGTEKLASKPGSEY